MIESELGLFPAFVGFPKVARLNRDVVVTEKVDGTNAQVLVREDGSVLAGSRNRWITPEDDNFGFAAWVAEHEDELRQLGPGNHFGEWWGQGVQRGYGLKERRFSLFNVHRWGDPSKRPACVGVVPELGRGPLSVTVESALGRLRDGGSVAAPGFPSPEGVVVFHTASGTLFKVTLKNDDEPKGKLVRS